jgi:hypothetical protein
MFLLIGPQKRAAGMFPSARVCHIKDIFQLWIITAGVDKGYALGAALHIAPHLVVPEVILSTGRGLRPLGKNHKLFMEGVFV